MLLIPRLTSPRLPLLRSALHKRQSDIQTRLLPQRKHALLLHPVPLRIDELQIESPEELCKDESHFGVCQAVLVSTPLNSTLRVKIGGVEGDLLLAQTIPRSEREGLHNFPVITFVLVRPLVVEPSFWYKRIWICEIARRVVRRVLRDVHARSTGNVVSADLLPLTGHNARETSRHGRIVA